MSRRRKAWLAKASRRRVEWNDYGGGRVVHRSKTFDTRKQAVDWMDKFNASIVLETSEVVPSPISIRAAFKEFIEGCTTLAESTRREYTTSIALLSAATGGKALADVTGADLDGMVTSRIAAGMAEATMAKHLRAINRLYRWAKRRRYVSRNPVHMMTATPQNRPRERPPLTDADVRAVLKHIDHPDQKLAVWLAMTTGLDRGVIESLTSVCVDLKAMTITVVRPKTGKKLSVPIHPHLRSKISTRLRQNPSGPLLSGVRRTKTNEWWKDACAAAGRPGLWFRDLRALAAVRLMRDAGLTLRDAQELLGHASVQTTARHYHIASPHIRAAVGKLSLPGLRERPERKTG